MSNSRYLINSYCFSRPIKTPSNPIIPSFVGSEFPMDILSQLILLDREEMLSTLLSFPEVDPNSKPVSYEFGVSPLMWAVDLKKEE